jgi:curli biogenesis system outer membrane secretion channel CsgG
VVTDFSDALACMNRKLVQHGVHDVVVTSGKLADATGLLKVGAKDMLVTAIAKMSGGSDAINYIEISTPAAMQDLGPLQTIDALVGAQNIQVWRPNYAIEGSFTEVNKNLISDRAGGGVVSDLLQANLQRDQDVGSIALDLHIVDLNGHRVVNNTATSTEILLVNAGKSGNVGATVAKSGVEFERSFDRNEAEGRAARTLVELATVEMFGRLLNLPYADCIRTVHGKANLEQARADYDALSAAARQAFFHAQLMRLGFNPGRNTDDVKLVEAITRFQKAVGLVPSGAINFETYNALRTTRLPKAAAARQTAAAAR